MYLHKIISGGQTGADQGALRAAKAADLETGGWIPRGFRTELGAAPELGEEYGLKEAPNISYVTRTHMNARDSDGTVIICSNEQSPGTKCTLRAVDYYRKHRLLIRMERAAPLQLAEWLWGHEIEVLNVAGNRESSCPGIGDFVEQFVSEAIRLLRRGLENAS